MSQQHSLGVMDAIIRRHSVRSFANEPVSPEQIESLLEAARLAPSSLNSQPWRFKVVRERGLLDSFGTREISRTQTWLARAGAIIVCCADLPGYVRDSQAAAFFFRENDLIKGDAMNGIEAYVAREASVDDAARFGAAAMNVGIAISFMMLRAVEIGLGTCWVGMFDEQNVKQLLGIDPALRIVGLLAVGRPDEDGRPDRHRKSLGDIVLP